MDKRLSIALLLTAIVVAVTPILFPTPKRTPAVTKAGSKIAAESVATQTVVPTANQIAPPRVGAVTDSNSVAPSQPLQGRTVTIDTKLASYQFSTLGAAPLSITMKEYRNLSPLKGQVDLKVPGRRLLEYYLVTGKDTLPLRNTDFQVLQSDRTVTFRGTVGGTPVAISYVITPDHYVARVSGRVESASPQSFLLIDMPSSLPVTEADTLGDLRNRSYSFKPMRSNARGIPFGKLDPGEKKLEAEPLTWAAVRNKYFVIGLIGLEGNAFDEMTITGGARTSKIATTASATLVKRIKNGTFAFDLYTGPQQSTQLLSLGRDFDHVNPYGWSFLQPVVNPIAALCIKLLLWLHVHLKLSYGWVLVLFGVFIRVALWPLNQSAMRSSLKMQEIQPRLAEVQKKYKDKPDKQREEMMRVYKEANASPFTALSGCLPMLIPMPVLFALFFVFQNTIEFRGVPFLWLMDISIKDPLFILPVLMGISMYILSWIGLKNAPPNPQAKMMSYMFPVMMTFVLANMASGLNLYYTAQNIAALPQQWLLARERQKARKT
jgi:YidC/Oxa1 family membrane protein insertase